MKLKDILTGYTGLFLGLLTTGLAVVALGNVTEVQFLSSIGGALFGASLGSLVGRLSTQDLKENIKQLVSEGVKESFVSDEQKIANYRKKWHIYHVTQMAGNFVWRHTHVDFTKSQTPGRLTSQTHLINKRDEPEPYTVEAGMRDWRFMIFLKASEGAEPALTYVFPLMGYRLYEAYYGLVFVQTWDGTNAISQAIASPTVLCNYEGEGTLPDDIASSIDQEWRRNIRNEHTFCPDISKKDLSRSS